MKRKPLRFSFLILALSFVALFGLRLIYGYMAFPSGGKDVEQVAGDLQSSFNYEGKNYASKKAKSKKSGSGSAHPLSVDQKYEKVGTITLKSKKYESDENKIRESIKLAGGLIQYEQSAGLEGSRSLHLAIGVVPEGFDSLIAKLKSFGALTSIRIDKVDKTNEYKMLQAKRMTLEATRNSLNGLKEMKAGSIEERINLEEKISITESQIQDLGVNLGDFDAENEFCTVKCSLLETMIKTSSGIGFAQRLKVAFEWSVKIYLRLVMIGFFGMIAVWAALMAIFQLGKYYPALKKVLESQAVT